MVGPPHCDAHAQNFAVTARLDAAILTQDKAGIATRRSFATLSSGSKIADLPARISFSVGNATATGKEKYGLEERVEWGYLRVDDDGDAEESTLFLAINVSEKIFNKLIFLFELGKQPAIKVEIKNEESLNKSIVDGRLDSWGENKSRHNFVKWCYFIIALPSKYSEKF